MAEAEALAEEAEQVSINGGPEDLQMFVAPREKASVVEAIIGLLSVSDLKKIRLLSRLVREKATPLLLKKDALQVQVWYSAARQSYTRFKNGNYPSSLDFVSRVIKSSYTQGKFPSTNFQFGYYFDFNLEMFNLFANYGRRIKTISLALDGPLKNKVLRELLLDKAPNLSRLEFRNFESFDDSKFLDEDELFAEGYGDERVMLPNLTSIYVGWLPSQRVRGMVRGLVRAAVNLERFEGYRFEYYGIFREFHKVNLIKHFDFLPTIANLSAIHTYANMDKEDPTLPKLTEMTVDLFGSFSQSMDMEAVTAKALQSILETSKTTLRKLCIGPTGHYPEFKLPALGNLGELRLLTWSFQKSFHMFSPLINIAETFPNLRMCDLTQLGMCQDGLVDYFPGGEVKVLTEETPSSDPGPSTSTSGNTTTTDILYSQTTTSYVFSTVKTLKINNAMTNEDLLFICHNFPNVKKVQVYCAKYLGVSNLIWTLPDEVEIIELHGIDMKTISLISNSLDTLFTGIEPAGLEQVRQKILQHDAEPPTKRVKIAFNSFPKNNAMSKLKRLKSVRVFLHQTFEFFQTPPAVDASPPEPDPTPQTSWYPFVTNIMTHFVSSAMPAGFKLEFLYDHGTRTWADCLNEVLQPLVSESIIVSHFDETYVHLMWSN